MSELISINTDYRGLQYLNSKGKIFFRGDIVFTEYDSEQLGPLYDFRIMDGVGFVRVKEYLGWIDCSEVFTQQLSPQPAEIESPPAEDDERDLLERVVDIEQYMNGTRGFPVVWVRLSTLDDQYDALEARIGEISERLAHTESVWKDDVLEGRVGECERLLGTYGGEIVRLSYEPGERLDEVEQRVSTLENVPPLTIQHHGPEGSHTTVTTGEMIMESAPEPQTVEPESSSDAQQEGERPQLKINQERLSVEIANHPADWDLSWDRCRECKEPWDKEHQERGSCPALVRPMSHPESERPNHKFESSQFTHLVHLLSVKRRRRSEGSYFPTQCHQRCGDRSCGRL